MKRTLEDGRFELDDDPERVDLDAVHAFLCRESYWALGRSRAETERLVRGSARVVGLYADGRQVGFARATFDGTVAFLNDVFVLAEHRGRGLGRELVREAVENAPFAGALWFLRTNDAHELYRKFGFAEPDERWMVRPPRRHGS